jgi:hypothetical protein
MMMIEGLIRTNAAELQTLLVKIGITEGSASILAPFMASLASAYEGLLIKGVSDKAAQDVYNTVIAGFMASHSEIQQEFEDLRKDPVKLEKALKVMLETITKVIGESIAEEAANEAQGELDIPTPPITTIH